MANHQPDKRHKGVGSRSGHDSFEIHDDKWTEDPDKDESSEDEDRRQTEAPPMSSKINLSKAVETLISSSSNTDCKAKQADETESIASNRAMEVEESPTPSAVTNNEPEETVQVFQLRSKHLYSHNSTLEGVFEDHVDPSKPSLGVPSTIRLKCEGKLDEGALNTRRTTVTESIYKAMPGIKENDFLIQESVHGQARKPKQTYLDVTFKVKEHMDKWALVIRVTRLPSLKPVHINKFLPSNQTFIHLRWVPPCYVGLVKLVTEQFKDVFDITDT